MRLDSIKLSGFKSFAEPTQFRLPGQLVGVVGPNGCGKSNIMDAVRWVLGESKASELRGESMQDVIFSGSGQRKPASRASVELVFGNEDGRAGGPWSRFAEIAVKRVLTRDGSSTYSINGQPVRRRDVQDVFLGTGLGPRAYAIIGQGTISRIIESRPEELRLFLEEAAGVSKYKERRRETENRLKDTRENLTRVDDILRELGAGLARLEQQAEVAGRYRALQAAGEEKRHQLWWLKHREAAADEARVQQAVEKAGLALEAKAAGLRGAEAELEAIRQAHYAANDALHARQGALAEAALEVSRLEERIRHVLEGRARVERRRAELDAQTALWADRRQAAEAELDALAGQITGAEDEGARLGAEVEAQAARVPALEESAGAARQASLAQRGRAGSVQQQIQVLAAEQRALDEQRRQLEVRRERLGAEQRRLAPPDIGRLAALEAGRTGAESAAAGAADRLKALADQVPALDAARRAEQAASTAASARRTELVARLDALRALQEKVQVEGKLQPWLMKHGLEALHGLWQRLRVEPGWETALEAALRERIGALEVGRLETVKAFALDPPPAKLVFYTSSEIASRGELRPAPAGLQRLVDALRLGDAGLAAVLGDWLAEVYTAPDLDAALAARAQLGPGALIVTPAGHAVGRHAVGFHAPDSAQAGLLARAKEIENLERETRAQGLIADTARLASNRAEAAHADASQRLAGARREAGELQTRAHQLQVEWVRLSQLAEAAGARHAQLDGELVEIDAQLTALAERAALEEVRFEALDRQLGVEQQRQSGCDDTVAVAEQAVAEARERLRGLERRAQEARFEARALAARHAELERERATAAQQLAQSAAQRTRLDEEWAGLADATAESGLQAALATRLEREAALGAERSAYDDLTLRLRRADEQRLQHAQALPPLQERITALQLEAQAARLGGAQYLEQLLAAQVDQEAVGAGIAAAGVRLGGLAGEIDRIEREVQALGAVNLAALDELSASRERKGFLDAQTADLQEAMATLEGAIQKIDLETRDLLASTFEQVNGHFGRMFPSLFGGGTARLVMTGDEILDAGVQVMAQPPGKKNATIHLLSGGEKALTAIALVFAIFQLNPAPFCLLDEVDAPLDDANTERYAKLVKEMAEATQFLFISHNRIAMGMAGQLIGVTMQEQGVSRIVTVDIEAAVGLAEAA